MSCTEIKKYAKLTVALGAALSIFYWLKLEKESDHVTHFSRVTQKFTAEMCEKYGFVCCGTGGSMVGRIKDVSIDFFCYEKKSIEEARKLEIDCAERFCEMINSNEKIRPYLEEFPFTSKRVGLMICFCKEDLTNYPPEESISLVMSSREKIYYMVTYDDHRPDQTILEEPYSEAYGKVKGHSFECDISGNGVCSLEL